MKGNRGKKIHFCCIQLSTRCCFPRGCISPAPSWELPLSIARSAEESRRCSSRGGRCEGYETIWGGSEGKQSGRLKPGKIVTPGMNG